MTQRSTTSANQPSPPFYALHQPGPHRNAHRASAVPPIVNPQVTDFAPHPVSVAVVLGRKIDTAVTVNPQITDSVTQTFVPLHLGTPGI